MDIFLGRQPIITVEGDMYAYELLYRNSEKNRFTDTGPERATATVLVNAFLSMGIDEVSGNYLSFINFNETMLEQDFITSLNPSRIVIELLENVELTPQLISRLETLREYGFRIALDDFILEDHPLQEKLFPLVSFIKVDFLNTTTSERNKIEKLIEINPHITLLAEKIETEEEFNLAKERGYRLFQGYYFAKPEVIKSKDIPANLTLYLHILHQLKDNSPDIDKIAELVMHDVSLSYKLLSYINSLSFDIPNKISSIRQAIMLIGTKEVKKWLQVLLLYDLGGNAKSGQMEALLNASLARAKFCELLSKRLGEKRTDEYFLVGMFSLVDRLIQRPWEDLFNHLPLSTTIKDTLRGKDTNLTPFLNIAIAIEDLDLNRVEKLISPFNLKMKDISDLSIEIQRWMYQFESLS